MHGKTMREALQEARNYRDPTNEGGPGSGPQKGGKKQSSADIKKAYGILNDPRYKQGNYSGAAKAIDKLSPGLSNHPDVKNAMKRANEEIEETMVVTKVDKDTNSPAYQKFKAGDKRYVYKEEVELSEKKANYIDIKLNSTNDLKRMMTWLDKNISPVNNELYDNAAQEGQSIIQFEDVPNVDKLMQKLKSARINFKVDTMESLDLSATGDTTTSNASQEDEIVEKIIPGQLAKLKKEWEPLRKVDMSKHQKTIDQIKVKLKRLNPSSLSQIVRADIFMVSDIAKELMKEEIDEAVVGLPFSRTLMYIIKTDRNTATRIKSFLADNGEKYPIHVDDNGSGQITLDAYNYTGGEKKAALAAAQAIAKKFNVKVNATR